MAVTRPTTHSKVQPLLSDTAGNAPTAAELGDQELALNYVDKELYYKQLDGVVGKTNISDRRYLDWAGTDPNYFVAGDPVKGFATRLGQTYKLITDPAVDPLDDSGEWLKIGWYKNKYNLQDYLKLDGTDEGAAARAFTESKPLGSVFIIPEGRTLGLSLNLRLLDDQEIRGAGRGATIKVVGGAGKHIILNRTAGTTIRVSNLTLDCDKVGNPGGLRNCIYGNTGTVIAKDVTVLNASDCGIRIANSKGSILENVRASNCERGVYINGLGTPTEFTSCNLDGLDVDLCRNGLNCHNVSGNYTNIKSYNNTQHGVVFTHSESGFTLTNVEAYGNQESGIVLGGASNANLGSNRNYHLNNIYTYNNTFIGLTIDPTVAGSDAKFEQDGTVTGVTSVNNGIHGINVTHSSDLIISNAISITNSQHGISLANSKGITLVSPITKTNLSYGINVVGMDAGSGDHNIISPIYIGNIQGTLKNTIPQNVFVSGESYRVWSVSASLHYVANDPVKGFAAHNGKIYRLQANAINNELGNGITIADRDALTGMLYGDYVLITGANSFYWDGAVWVDSGATTAPTVPPNASIDPELNSGAWIDAAI